MTIESKPPGASQRIDLASGAIALGAALVGSLGYGFGGIVGAILAVILAGLAGTLLVPALAPKSRVAPQAAAQVIPSAAPSPSIPEDRTDDLTGLANENGLKAWFAEHTPRLVEEKLSIIVLSASLEGFDAIVRGRGKVVADKVLIEVAHRIAAFAGEAGIAARTGGGEFASKVSVVAEHSVEKASEIAAKMAEVLQRPVEISEGVIWIGACVGAAAGPAAEGLGVLARARSALAKAKQVGLGHYVVDKG